MKRLKREIGKSRVVLKMCVVLRCVINAINSAREGRVKHVSFARPV
jgi:hypothetical protein